MREEERRLIQLHELIAKIEVLVTATREQEIVEQFSTPLQELEDFAFERRRELGWTMQDHIDWEDEQFILEYGAEMGDEDDEDDE